MDTIWGVKPIGVKEQLIDKTIRLFNAAIRRGEKLDANYVNSLTMPCGYIVHPEVCQDDVMAWALRHKFNPNATFYKMWDDVTNKSRLRLYIDQIFHYASTYGTDFTGTPYIPNDDPFLVELTKCKTIGVITENKAIERCEKMLFSGVALAQETIKDIVFIFKQLYHTVDINNIRNREAKMYLYDELDMLPNNAEELVRYLVFKATGETMVIKNKELIQKIKDSRYDITIKLSNRDVQILSTVFFRYKPLLLAFKKTSMRNSVWINRIRKMADKNHVAKSLTFTEEILSDKYVLALDDITTFNGLSNFKKVQLLQTIRIRQKQLDFRPFVIRNQKLYVKEENKVFKNSHGMYSILYTSLINSLAAKACKIKLPKDINITLPTSEKSFIGNYPLGTSISLAGKYAIVGINWREEDGAHDLDLSLNNLEGNKIGWNSSYYSRTGSVIYSGDMTSADPEASELIYAEHGMIDGIIKVNRYHGAENSKFKMFVATEKIAHMHKNYMVDPNNIIFQVDDVMDVKEKSLCIITGGRLTLAKFKTGNKRVSGKSITDKYIEYVNATQDCYISLRNVLTDAGFEIVEENQDIDLTNLSKDTLIKLLS